MRKLLFINFILFFHLSVIGQSNELHPIDLKRENCHNSEINQTTQGMIECERAAKDEWEKELNTYYQLLLEKMTIMEQEKLKQAQNKWMSYRDQEFDFSGTLYTNMQGTM
jgi:uncharacterized protein YecT (DUF1311 family)